MRYISNFILIFYCTCSLVFGAAFTSKASGNWSSSGQTTWNEAGVPGDGDTVTINAGHTITVDVDTTVGHSPATGDGTQAILVNGTDAKLIIPSGVTLNCRGDLFMTKGYIELNSGSLNLDASTSVAPTTTAYRLNLGNSGVVNDINAVYFISTGDEDNRSTITSSNEKGEILSNWGIGYISIEYLNMCDLSKIAKLSTRVGDLNIQHNNWIDMPSTFMTELGFVANAYVNYNHFKRDVATYAFNIKNNESNVSDKDFSNNIFDCRVSLEHSGHINFDNCLINKLVVGFSTVEFNSLKNILFYQTSVATGYTSYNDSEGIVKDPLLYYSHNQELVHSEGGIYSTGTMHLDGGISEFDHDEPTANTVLGNNVDQSASSDTYIKNFIITKNAGGKASSSLTMLKGSKFSRLSVENCTITARGYLSDNQGGFLVGAGGSMAGWAGQVASFKNNLIYNPTESLISQRFPANQDATTAVMTGTGLAGSDTTTLVSTSVFSSGETYHTLEGTYFVKITTGADAGLIRAVTASTPTTVTVNAFPNTMLGEDFICFPVDQLNPTNVDYNAWYGFKAENNMYDDQNDLYSSTTTGYWGFRGSDPSAIGANDVIDQSGSPSFVDSDRCLATFSIDYLGESAGTAWAVATAYVVGDVVSITDAGFYGGQTVNFVCLQDHTSASTDEPGNYDDDWREHWEFQSFKMIKDNIIGLSTANVDATEANYLAWMQAGYAPTNSALFTSGEGGTYIGAVEGVSAGGFSFLDIYNIGKK